MEEQLIFDNKSKDSIEKNKDIKNICTIHFEFINLSMPHIISPYKDLLRIAIKNSFSSSSPKLNTQGTQNCTLSEFLRTAVTSHCPPQRLLVKIIWSERRVATGESEPVGRGKITIILTFPRSIRVAFKGTVRTKNS